MNLEYPFHTAFILFFATIVAIRMYFAGYADAASGVGQTTKGEGAFRVIRVVLGTPMFIAFLAYMVWPPWMAWSQLALDPRLRWAGALVAIATVAMLVWVQRHLSRNFTGTVQIRPGGHLVMTGPYAYVRHPMYITFLLLTLATFLLTASWFLGGGILIIFLCVMIVRTPVEEEELEKAYGEEYRAYRAKTGKFLPKLLR